MVTEDRMRTLFVHANPVPDASAIELDPVNAAAYLDAIELRSSDMTRPESTTETTEKKSRNLRAGLVGAVAVVAVVLAGALIAQTRSDETASAASVTDVWVSTDGVYVVFNEDGTYGASWTLEDVAEGPFERGTWHFEDEVFVWSASTGNCTVDEEGLAGRYTIEHVDAQTTNWVPINDPCLDRVRDLAGGPMYRVTE